jgi:hypothetical protein
MMVNREMEKLELIMNDLFQFNQTKLIHGINAQKCLEQINLISNQLTDIQVEKYVDMALNPFGPLD